MENKYYTPDLEEFYEGFQCELKAIDNGEWIKHSFSMHNMSFKDTAHITEHAVVFWLKKGGVRVKYLDASDIENEGFKNDEISSKFGNELRYEICGGFWPKNGLNGYWMDVSKINNTHITIYIAYANQYTVDGPKHETIFKGIIKNISEFRKLLKQLGIKQHVG